MCILTFDVSHWGDCIALGDFWQALAVPPSASGPDRWHERTINELNVNRQGALCVCVPSVSE